MISRISTLISRISTPIPHIPNLNTRIPTVILRIPTLITCIPITIPFIPTLIAHIPTLIPRISRIPKISTLIPRVPTVIPCVPTLIPSVPIIPLVPFLDSPFRLLQIFMCWFMYLLRDKEFAGHVTNYLEIHKQLFARQKSTLSTNGVFLLCHICVQNESIVWKCVIIKEVFAQNRHSICKLRDCNGTSTNNHIVCKQTLNQLFSQTGQFD